MTRAVLVAGGAGFIGSHVCEELLKQGNRVYCLDNLSSGLKSNVSHLESFNTFVFQNADVRSPISITQKCESVLNLASRASRSEWETYPTEVLTANAIGSRNLLEYARACNATYMYMSSSEVYGNPTVVPTPEDYEGRVSSIGIRSPYDEGKRFGESLAMAYYREWGVPVKIIRLFNTYGPRIRSDAEYARVIPRLVEEALHGEALTVYGDGSQTRSFVYVSDVIDAISKIMQADCSGEVFNIGNSSEISIVELARRILKLTASKSTIAYSPLPKDDPRRRCPDITRAARRLNWKPQVTLEEGLERLLTWYKEN